MIDSCPICDSKFLESISGVEDFEYGFQHNAKMLRCMQCAHIFMVPIPDLKTVRSFYPSDYHAYAKRESVLGNFLISIFSSFQISCILRNLTKRNGNILEIGCAQGDFLKALGKRGNFELWGTDIAEEPVYFAKQGGVNAYCGDLSNLDLPRSYFDLIIMNNVVEHLSDPKNQVRICNELLKPSGILFIETPNSQCLDYKVFGKYWFGFHYPRHLNIFSRKSVGSLSGYTGFECAEILNVMHPGTWAISMQNFLSSKSLLLKKFLGSGRELAGYFLMVLLIPWSFLEVKILPSSGVMRVVFKKPAS